MLTVQVGRETSKLIIMLTRDDYMGMSKGPMNPERDMTLPEMEGSRTASLISQRLNYFKIMTAYTFLFVFCIYKLKD